MATPWIKSLASEVAKRATRIIKIIFELHIDFLSTVTILLAPKSDWGESGFKIDQNSAWCHSSFVRMLSIRPYCLCELPTAFNERMFLHDPVFVFLMLKGYYIALNAKVINKVHIHKFLKYVTVCRYWFFFIFYVYGKNVIKIWRCIFTHHKR